MTTNDTKATAAAMRSALRNAFPGTKFSVRMDRGTAYGWITVSWEDGPTAKDVEAITYRFQSSRFSGSDDSYHSTGVTEWSCCGVGISRHISRDRMEAAKRTIRTNRQGDRYISEAGVTAWEVYAGQDDELLAYSWCAQMTFLAGAA